MKLSKLSCWLYLFYTWCTLYQNASIQVYCVQSTISQSKSVSNFRIVGIFSNSLHFNTSSQQCNLYSVRDIQFTQALIYAIQTLINNDSKLLPDVNLGWTIEDSCSSRELAVSNMASLLLSDKQQMSISETCHNHLNIETDDSEYLYVSNITSNKCNPSPIIGIIGENSDFITSALASLTSSLRYSQIGFDSFNTIFSDRRLFPYYYRTNSLASTQAKSLFSIFERFNWNHIPIIAAGNTEIIRVLPLIVNLQQNFHVCIDPVIKIYDNYTTADLTDIILQWKSRTRPRVVLLFGHETIIYNLLKQAEIHNLTGITFLGGYGWLNSPRIYTIRTDIIAGAIGMAYSGSSLEHFYTYLNQLDFCNNRQNPWFIKAWRQKLLHADLDVQKLLQNCTIDDKLKQQYFSEFYNVHFISTVIIDSVLAYSYVLRDTLSCNNSTCVHQSSNDFDRDKFNTILSKIKFAGVTSSHVTVDSDGNIELSFDIINLQVDTSTPRRNVKPVKIGYWTKAKGLTIQQDKIVWNGNRTWFDIPSARCSQDCPAGYYQHKDTTIPTHLRSCCWKCRTCPSNQISNTTNSQQCTPCPRLAKPNANSSSCVEFPIAYVELDSPLSIIICIVAISHCICLTFIWIVMIIKRNTPVVKGSNFILVNVLLFFIGMCIPTAILFLLPTTIATCQARMFASTITQIGIYLTILCKINQVSLIFRSAIIRKKKLHFLTKTVNQVVLICVILAVISGILVCLNILMPIRVNQLPSAKKQMQLTCHAPNSFGKINLSVWQGLISVTCLILAFKARSLPENFNESKYIFLSTLFITIINICSRPVLIILTGNIADKIAALTVLIFGMFPMICFFTPKIYIIYYRPRLNTKEEAMASITNYTFSNSNHSRIRQLATDLNKNYPQAVSFENQSLILSSNRILPNPID